MDPDQTLAPGDQVVVFPNNPQATQVSGLVKFIREAGFDVRLDAIVQRPDGYFSSGTILPVLWANVERIEHAPTQPAEREMWKLTQAWSLPLVVRTYESNKYGEAAYASEAAVLAQHNYHPTLQTAEGSHLHAGRLLLTGGLSVFAGRSGIRSKGKLTVTYQHVSPTATVAPTPSAGPADPMDQIRRLAQLRDDGILTTEEFEAKKADLLSRM